MSEEKESTAPNVPRLVLCDDELYVLRAAEIKFQRAGYNVRSAMDGEEAWSLIAEWRPDVVVTDCQMPFLDGLQLARRIHESEDLPNVPVVMLTAKGFELSEKQLRDEYGVDLLFAKPFSPRALLNAVTELLAERRKTDPSTADTQPFVAP